MPKRNISNGAYNKGSKDFNAPSSTRHAQRSADARKHSSLQGIGGSHGGAIDDPVKVAKGGLDARRGTQVHCCSAKAKENIQPPSAHEHSGFGGIGGKVKTTI